MATLRETNGHVFDIRYRFQRPSAWDHQAEFERLVLLLGEGPLDLIQAELDVGSLSSAWQQFRSAERVLGEIDASLSSEDQGDDQGDQLERVRGFLSLVMLVLRMLSEVLGRESLQTLMTGHFERAQAQVKRGDSWELFTPAVIDALDDPLLPGFILGHIFVEVARPFLRLLPKLSGGGQGPS